jgi:hypothetical protein
MEITVNCTDRLVQNHESIFRKEEDGAFLFDPETGMLKYINNMGVNIYQLCDGGMTVGDITAMIIENYTGVSGDQIENDIKRFLGTLVEMKYLNREETSND